MRSRDSSAIRRTPGRICSPSGRWNWSRRTCGKPARKDAISAARRRMAEACYLAGMTLANVGVGIPHALGQALGALKDTPHGESCAACVIPTISWTLPDCHEKLAQVATIFDPGLAESRKDRSAAMLPALLRNFFNDIGLKSSFKSLGLDLSEVDRLVAIAFTNYGQDIACSAKPANSADIRRIVMDCL